MVTTDSHSSHSYLPGFRTLWIYQRERFPLIGHGMLIVVFTFSGVIHSTTHTAAAVLPRIVEIAAGTLTLLLTFFLLRLLDEFKDAEDDARYRPYRPVPRGLVTLAQLRRLVILTVIVQLAVQTVWLPKLLPLLLVIYGYLILMAIEFGIPRWLKAHPPVYLFSHMLIMPLLGIYATGIHWLGHYPVTPQVGLFACLALANGLVIELGRKIRAPESEEAGVETYSNLYGPVWAGRLWCLALTAAALPLLIMVPHGVSAAIVAALWLVGCVVSSRYCRTPSELWSNAIRNFSSLWVLAGYALVAVMPLGQVVAGGAK